MKESRDLYKAIGKSVLGRYSVYLANLISMMILARVFTPEIFGVVAAIMVFYLFFQLMAEAGLSPAIINLTKFSPVERDGVFSLTFLFGIFLAVCFFYSSSFIVLFYKIDGIEKVIPFVSISLLFFSLTIVPSAFLLRDQFFYKVAISGSTSEIVSTLVAILFSFFIDPVYALSTKYLVNAIMLYLIQFYFSSETEFGRPTLGSKLSAIKPLLSFSLYQFGFNFINFFSRNLDNILIGKYLGATSLGIYDKSYQLMKYPLMLLTFAMTPAIQPVIRKNKNDKNKIEKIHTSFTFKLSLVAVLAGLGMFFLSEFIVLIMLGEQWLGVVPIIQILAISIPVQVVASTSGSFFQAMDRAGVLFLSGCLSAILMVLAIVMGIRQGDMLLISWYLVVAMHINFIQTYFLMYVKVFNKSPIYFFIKMVPLFASTAALSFYAIKVK